MPESRGFIRFRSIRVAKYPSEADRRARGLDDQVIGAVRFGVTVTSIVARDREDSLGSGVWPLAVSGLRDVRQSAIAAGQRAIQRDAVRPTSGQCPPARVSLLTR